MSVRDTADYEQSEEEAIRSGKQALARAPWLFSRTVEGTKGFFAELRTNDSVHPRHYAVHSVDGNGTKLYLSPWSGKYGLAPIDGIAMNANDMATLIRVCPDTLNIYFACQTEIEEKHMGEIMAGFVNAAERIRIPNAPWDMNVGKMETASLDEMVSLGVPGKGHDFGISMTGFIEKTKVPNLNPRPGDLIVGVSSTGLHSNGFTGARHVLFAPAPDVEYRGEWRTQYNGRFALNDKPGILEGMTVLEALQVPTALYLVEAALIGQKFDSRDIYGVNITGNGLANFNRAGQGVSFHITDPLPLLPIHKLLIQESGWSPETSYRKQNNGLGFAYIVPSLLAPAVVDLINQRGENKAQIIGEVRKGDEILKTTIHKPYEGKPITYSRYSN